MARSCALFAPVVGEMARGADLGRPQQNDHSVIPERL